MRSICLNFVISSPILISKDVGTKIDGEKIAKTIIADYFTNINEVLLQLGNEFGRLFKFSISISEQSIAFYEKYEPSFLMSLNKLNKRFFSVNYVLPSSAIFNTEGNLFEKQLKSQELTIKRVFDIDISKILFSDLCFSQRLAVDAKKNGIKAAFIGNRKQNNNYIDGNSCGLEMTSNLQIINIDSEFQALLISKKMKTENILNYLNNIDEANELVYANIYYFDFVENPNLINILRELPEAVMSSTNFSFVNAEELVKYRGDAQELNRDFNIQNHNCVKESFFLQNAVKRFDMMGFVNIKNNKNSDIFDKLFQSNIINMDFYRDYYFGFYKHSYIKGLIGIESVNELKENELRIWENFHTEYKSYQNHNKANSRYRFSDLESIPKILLKNLLLDLDYIIIYYAIYGSSDFMKDRVLSNISKSKLYKMEDLFESEIKVNDSQMRNARRRILNRLNKLN